MRRHAKASTAGSIFAKTSRAPAVAILSVVAMLLTASPALAIETHPFIGNLGSANQPSFANAEGLAVDHATGDVLVADAGAATISRWHADGTPANFSALATNVIDGEGGSDETPEGGLRFPVPSEVQIAVDSSAGVAKGDIYVAQSSRHLIYIFSSSGAYLGKLDAAGSENFGETCGVAVDSSGAVYAGDFSSAVHKFVPTANPPTNTDNTANFTTESPCNLVAGAGPSAGSIFVSSQTNRNRVSKLNATTGASEYVVSPSSVGVLSVDPNNGHLYVAEEGAVVEYNVSGSSPAQLTSLSLDSRVQGIATDGNLYLSSEHVAHVEVFGPTAALPEPFVQKATAIERTTATLNGTISAAGGPSSSCEFQYTSEENFEAKGYEGASTAPCVPVGPFIGTSTQTVSAGVSGLAARTTYRFRLVGTNENGSHASTSLGFETKQPLSVKTGKASNLAVGAATLNATVNPEGLAVEECSFEYGEGTEPYEQTVPCAGNPADLGSGSEPKAVHADVSGLNPGATYHFRVSAKNSLGATNGADFIFGPPLVKANSVAEVTRTSAIVSGLVNPTGVETTYVVQYVTEDDFNTDEFAKATEVPLGGEAIGSGAEDVKVAQPISGLTPHTVYYFRILAKNGAGTNAGPEKSFTTYVEAGAGLPDGRVFEQVTPVNKNGAAPSGGENEVQAASDGSGIVFSSHGGLPGGEGSQQFPSYLAHRGSDWATQGLLPPASQGSVGVVNGWSEDLTQSYVGQADLVGKPLSFLVRDNASRALRPMGPGGEKGVSTFNYVDTSADGSVVAFESLTPLSPGGASGFEVRNTYVWDRESGELRLAGILNDGQPPVEGSLAGSNQGRPTDGSFNQALNTHYTQLQNTLSADGSHIFFTGAVNHQLYVRLNPTKPQSALNGEEECTEAAMACTIEVSASQRSTPDPMGEKPAAFINATTDGSQVFFTSSGKLTDDATTGPADLGKDLYRYDVASGVLSDLTLDSKDFFGAEVQGVLGTSDDGSYVYFAANAVLAEGATEGTCESITWSSSGTGECNLYLWHNGVFSFIARQQMSGDYLSADSANWMSTSYGGNEKSSRVSPDGKTLLFRSRLKQTNYDNEKVLEFYRYSAEGGGLICITCNPTGTAPVGGSRLQSITQSAGGASFAGILTRNLSADGKRVFFETPEKLVAADTNGDNGCPFSDEVNKRAPRCLDVYEWEAKGSGSCQSEDQNGGCLYLISTGTSQEPSYFGDASASGDDAFIFTGQSLVGQDKDQIVDIYDARIGGGIASQNPPPPPDPCEGEACRQGVPAPPASQSAGSASFSGPDNPKPARHTKKSKHKKSHKKAHKKQSKHKKSHASRKHG